MPIDPGTATVIASILSTGGQALMGGGGEEEASRSAHERIRHERDALLLELILEADKIAQANEQAQLQDQLRFRNQRAQSGIVEQQLQRAFSPMDRPFSGVMARQRPETYVPAGGGPGAALTPGGQAATPEQLSQLIPRNLNQYIAMRERARGISSNFSVDNLYQPLAVDRADPFDSLRRRAPGLENELLDEGRFMTGFDTDRTEGLTTGQTQDLNRRRQGGMTPEELAAEIDRLRRGNPVGARREVG